MAAMQLLKSLAVSPSVVLTNDWFAGLAAGYRNVGLFGAHFKVC